MESAAQYIEQTPLFDELKSFLAASRENGGIYGLKGSAAAFTIATAANLVTPPIVVISPDGEAASTCAADVRFYLNQDEHFKQPLTDEVVRYPSSTLPPYSFSGLESDLWVNRMTALSRLSEGRAPRVFCIGLDALVRKIVPKESLVAAGFQIHLGQEIDRDELLRMLIDAGFSRAPLVEDTGDFSVRGFIIDIYSPMYPYPVRIEQMGDCIESIRFFDPTTQRSKENVSELYISPVHMIVPDEETRDQGLTELLHICEEKGVEKRVRQGLINDFKHKIRFPGAEYYLPLFFPKLETIFDYLPPETVLIIPDRETINRAFEDIRDEIFTRWETAATEGMPILSPDKTYMFQDEFCSEIAKFRNVTISPLEVEDSNQKSYRVKCESNEDIRAALLKSKAYDQTMGNLVEKLKNWRDDGSEVFLVSHTQGQANRLMRLLDPYNLKLDYHGPGFDRINLDTASTPGIRLYVGGLSSGFRLPAARRVIITEEEIFGSRVRATSRKRARGAVLSSLTDLVEGEHVVHEDYGIGVFRGLQRREFQGIVSEVMLIQYEGEDLLYLPVERMQVVQKYISGSDSAPRLDRLGGKGWEKTKARIKKSIRDMAKELLDIYAKRRVAKRDPYSAPDEHYAAFEAAFEFEETPDQARAIQDVMESMDTDIPMDRLVCGDAGYGKTEVAIRAAFRVIMDAKQVAVLAPTTILAQQHFETFSKRFEGYPFKVEMMSRFRSSAQLKVIRKELEEGKIDIIIGTHKLLSKDVKFRDLGLLVVDEEQRFGVAHKERIKQFKANIDVLTLTATPIPRTLNMSLTGIRDLSVIETPPNSRQTIRTHVTRKTDDVIKEALGRELSRGGQAFYLHNRVASINRTAGMVQTLVPGARIGVAHGQMPERELENVMMEFVTGKINVLVSTSIIESGLDIPRANTILIERSDTFGLSDLYQIRGRVGRSNMRAYAYLLTPHETAMTHDAIKRLAVIQEHSDMGQGFRIALRDMEIRGAGNILGTSQSGHVAQVGYEMFLELLEEAVQEIRGVPAEPRINPEILLKIEVYIPEEYVPEPQQRMNLYKRLSTASSDLEINEIEDEILDRYGKAPTPVNQLIQIMRIRLLMKELRITKLDYNGKDMTFHFNEETPVRPEFLAFWGQNDKRSRLYPDSKFGYHVGDIDAESRIGQCYGLLGKMKKGADKQDAQPSAESMIITRLRKAGNLKTT